MRFLPVLAASLALLVSPARAETPKACATAILTLADAVLAGREKLPKLKARGIGAEAGYLKIRYGGLSPDEAATLAHGLRDAGVREALDLAGAVDAWRGGFAAVTVTPAELGGQISTLRAILQHGDAEALLAALAALPPEKRISTLQRIVPAVVDWPDEKKIALSAIARKHDLAYLEAGLAATLRDPDGWADFAASFRDPTKLMDFVQAWSWAPALVGHPVLPRYPLKAADMEAARRAIHTITITAAREPERDFLMTYLNQTGDIPATEKAAQVLLAAVDTGEIRQDGLLDPAWLTAYRALRAASADPAAMDGTLATIPFYGRHYLTANGERTVRDVIDRLVAIEALTPYLTGKQPALPAMPADLSAAFQPAWPAWSEMAGALKTAPLTPLAKDGEKASIVAELLFAAGDTARLADFVLAVEPPEAQLAMATDFAMRLDRGCGSAMYHPGEAMMLSGQPIYRFDPVQ